MRRFPHALFALGLLLLPLAGCDSGGGGEGPEAADVPEAERYGGTLVMGFISDIADMSPLTSTDLYANQMQQFVLFMPLLQYDEKFEPQPYFARSWEVNEDTTLLTFHLRDDVYWHDGVKTSAHDVKFSYDRARDPATGFANAAFWTYYGDAEVVDSFTFRIALRPHAEFLDPWRSFAPVPQHVLKDVPAAALRNNPFATTAPVGNGPFRFVSRAPGQSWTFAANDRFPRELGGRPYVDRLVWRVIPEQTTLLTELLTGGVDYYVAPPPVQAKQIEASGEARLVRFPFRSFMLAAWNERRPPFDDVRVRRALTMAIDRQGIIDGIVYGYGDLANSTVPTFYWQHDPQAGAELKHDPAAAKALLAEAGFTDRDGDGVVEGADGKPFRFTLKTNKGPTERADMVEKIQSDLRAVGIAVEPQIVEFATLLDQLQKTRDFDGVVIGWSTEFRIDDSDMFHCDKREGPFQWAGYCDPQTDSLLTALPLVADREAAKPLWSRYQRKIAQDQPFTFLYFQHRLEGVRNRLQGVAPDARGDWVGIRKWWIVPGERSAAPTE